MESRDEISTLRETLDRLDRGHHADAAARMSTGVLAGLLSVE